MMKRDDRRTTTYALESIKMSENQAIWKRKIEKERDLLIDMTIDRYPLLHFTSILTNFLT